MPIFFSVRVIFSINGNFSRQASKSPNYSYSSSLLLLFGTTTNKLWTLASDKQQCFSEVLRRRRLYPFSIHVQDLLPRPDKALQEQTQSANFLRLLMLLKIAATTNYDALLMLEGEEDENTMVCFFFNLKKLWLMLPLPAPRTTTKPKMWPDGHGNFQNWPTLLIKVNMHSSRTDVAMTKTTYSSLNLRNC